MNIDVFERLQQAEECTGRARLLDHLAQIDQITGRARLIERLRLAESLKEAHERKG